MSAFAFPALPCQAFPCRPFGLDCTPSAHVDCPAFSARGMLSCGQGLHFPGVFSALSRHRHIRFLTLANSGCIITMAVGIAQLAEHRTVAPTVAGSIPVSHPRISCLDFPASDFPACVLRFARTFSNTSD